MTNTDFNKIRFLLAVDPSLTCSGWALFDLRSDKLCGIGKIRSLKPSIPLPLRFKNLQQQIQGLFEQVKFSPEDIIVCEAPTTMRDPKAAFKVEQVRGIFETLARKKGALVPGRLNPRTVQSELLGLKGKQLKRTLVKSAACTAAAHLFSGALKDLGFKEVDRLNKHQDIVDALLIGSVVISRLKRLKSAKVSIRELSLENW